MFTNIKIALHEFDWTRYSEYVLTWIIGTIGVIAILVLAIGLSFLMYGFLSALGIAKYLPYIFAFATLPPLAYYFAAKKWHRLR